MVERTNNGPSRRHDRDHVSDSIGHPNLPLSFSGRGVFFPKHMTRKQLTALAAIPCAIGLAWLALRPDVSPSESGTTITSDNQGGQRSRDDSPVAGRLTQPRYPITPASSAPPGRWKGEYPADALQKADSLRPGKLRDRLLQQTVKDWATKSPEDAKQWAANRKDPAERERLLQSIHGDLNAVESTPSEQQTVEKLGQAVERFDSDESERVRIEELTEAWALANLNAAREWVLEQPAGELRDELVSRIALMQAKVNPAEAATFVTGHIPPGAAYDEAVITVLHQWTLQDRGAAAAWIESFPAGSLKTRAQKELAGMAVYRANDVTR